MKNVEGWQAAQALWVDDCKRRGVNRLHVWLRKRRYSPWGRITWDIQFPNRFCVGLWFFGHRPLRVEWHRKSAAAVNPSDVLPKDVLDAIPD